VDYCLDGKKFKEMIPKLYYVGPERGILNKTQFAIWQITGVFQTCLIYFVTINVFGVNHITSEDGTTSDLWIMSLTCFTASVVVINLKITLLTRYNTILTILSIFLTILAYVGYMWISNWEADGHMEMTVSYAHSSTLLFMCLFFSCGTCLLVDMAIEAVQ
jgi:magnesium-transporting ATPase (P-type)